MENQPTENTRLELRWPKSYRVGIWIFFGLMFSFFVVCIVSVFNKEITVRANSTEKNSIIVAVNIFFVCLLILLLQLFLYKRKVIAENNFVVFKYVFKKNLNVPYEKIAKIALVNTRDRHKIGGMWSLIGAEVWIYDKDRKIGGIIISLKKVSDFAKFIENKSVKIELLD